MVIPNPGIEKAQDPGSGSAILFYSSDENAKCTVAGTLVNWLMF
jgi:hypothetical protein